MRYRECFNERKHHNCQGYMPRHLTASSSFPISSFDVELGRFPAGSYEVVVIQTNPQRLLLTPRLR